MIETIPDLWGPLDVTVISPVAILRSQASKLTERTKGLLEGDVLTAAEERGVRHTFYIVAPALRRYRYALLEVTHGTEDIFPAAVLFSWKDEDPFTTPKLHNRLFPGDAESISSRSAATTDEFVRLIGDALRSSRAKATISSLIARSNDATAGEK